MKLLKFVCGIFGHFPKDHRKLHDTNNVIGPVKCRVCGYLGYVDYNNLYIEDFRTEINIAQQEKDRY